ncbi:MAG TPA: outer membrane beta-barrel protein [Vicinamibacterales bacterium]|nr:outer membrane beta-barrel protein [Vicinamibacterales bacterium]
MRSRALLAPIVVLTLLAVAAPAAAQDEPRFTVAGSYTILNDSDLEETFPVGWLLAVTRNLNSTFSLVGEMGGNYKTLELGGDDIDFKVHAFLAGVRVRSARANVIPFAQVLAGVANGSVSVPGTGESDSSNGFAVQPGAGIDFNFTPSAGLRLQADYRLIRDEGENTNQFRFAAGIVFGFGR